MTDETKPAWWRCPACKNRVWNDPIDKEHHGRSCPADLKRAIVRLAARVEELEKRETPEPVQLEAVHAGPDLDSVDEDDAADGPEDPEEQEVPDVAPIFEEVVGLHVAPAIDDYGDEDDDDDDDDDEQAPISRPVMR